MSETADIIAVRLVAETETAERRIRAYGGSVQRTMAGVERSTARAAGAVAVDARQRQAAWRALGAAVADAVGASGAATVAATPDIDALLAALGQVERGGSVIAPARIEAIGKAAATLQRDLAQGLAGAIVAGKSLGDVLVDCFARAGVALIKSQITRLLDPPGDGASDLIKGLTGAIGGLLPRPPGRASGGHVAAGQLYRVNEAGVEGFRPAGSGTIVPLGRMAAARAGGGVTVVQPMKISFAGAITTPELMAQFKAYADGVGQAAVVGGAAMAQAKLAKRAARALPR